ncbi:hypothetical protein [Saccharopolyspora phatthalungensis]|uniref:Uncharacterized protein n=1 Tax=Saccharopolyspora phatthalungensis TaxID=664693 RepID=A0A840Q576_9PSEU|nr:hypothetical protein [Saccharopolyspora phatthalungensis]MBB5153515.1 hypothetical protein [Saccharopolyspora phatthalungensis]
MDKDAAWEQMLRDSVCPIRDSGLLELVDVPAEGIELEPGGPAAAGTHFPAPTGGVVRREGNGYRPRP